MLALTLFTVSLSPSLGPLQSDPLAQAVTTPVKGGYLRLQVWADDIVRVEFSNSKSFFGHGSLVTLDDQRKRVIYRCIEKAGELDLRTKKLDVRVKLPEGQVSFYDSSGHQILTESKEGRSLLAANVQGVDTYHARQQWAPDPTEALYGLGQHQLGLMDIKGYDIDLWQHNGTVSIPFLVSSKGYGILWDNPSYTRFGDLRTPELIPSGQLLDEKGKPGGLTGRYYAGSQFDRLVGTRLDAKLDFEPTGQGRQARIFPGLPGGDSSVVWNGYIVPDASGEYLFDGFSNGGLTVVLDSTTLMNHWRQSWLPWVDVGRVRLAAHHRYPITIRWVRDQGANTFRLRWKTPPLAAATSLWSEVADGIDYTFVYGPSLSRVIAGYRQVTGRATLMPKWAFGLWQSRQRYNTQLESLDVVKGFRSRQIPFDNIVQDWFYWRENAWGSHEFDPARFPDPQGWIDSIHALHANLMISVWPKFYPGTANFEAMNSAGYLFQPNLKEGLRDWVRYPYTFYDAYNPGARELFWAQMDRELFSKHVDAWWMDATEPDLLPQPTLEGAKTHMTPTYLGPASKVLNAFPLENSRAVYEGQRKAAPDQRVFILTRSGYAGMQRYAAATWSGDISSTWTAMAKQIRAGLGFSISGMPYWTMDTGGFSVPPRFSARNPKKADVDEWRELNARWFEFGTFVPLLRVHGESPFREMWQFGGEESPTYEAELKFDTLRYRLLPYIYSLAGAVTFDGDTFMRPLVMDFSGDPVARETGDQYMFGKELLVCPVTSYKARERSVYLPKGLWYDFWSGHGIQGGRTITAPAPYDQIPIFVRAGSILPVGPPLQYTSEKPADPLTLVVYPGLSGSFNLYEDDGKSYGYEKGLCSTIPFAWDDIKQTLTIGKRVGAFPVMLQSRTFRVVLQHGTGGYPFPQDGAVQVAYKGEKLTLKFARKG